MTDYFASVLGLAYESSLTQFTVRTGPGTSFAKASFKALKASKLLPVLTIEPDVNEAKSDFGRVYQWFKLQFPDGQEGWLRGHVVGIQGDFNAYGYGYIPEATHAYLLDRDESKTGPAPAVVETGVAEEQASEVTKTDTTDTEEKENPFAKAIASGEATVSGPESGTAATSSGGGSSGFGGGTSASSGGGSSSGGATSTPTAEPEITTTPTTTPVKEESTAVAKPTASATAVIKTKNAANTREGPSTVGYNRIFTIPRLAPVPILEIREENRAQHYNWFRVQYQGNEGWIREDLVRYEGDTERFGLPWDLYPAPMRDNAWWVRGYNQPPNQDTSTWAHKGWDMGANTGEPIYCGPYGGEVVQVLDCTKCSPGAPSTVMNGIQLGDSSVYSDAGWGFGYGTFVIVGYHNDVLPESTRSALKQKGFSGGSLYVIYAHLQKRLVDKGALLAANTIIGYCGNTGNSEATHLHLEVRMGSSSQFPGWAALGSKNLVNPSVLFSR